MGAPVAFATGSKILFVFSLVIFIFGLCGSAVQMWMTYTLSSTFGDIKFDFGLYMTYMKSDDDAVADYLDDEGSKVDISDLDDDSFPDNSGFTLGAARAGSVLLMLVGLASAAYLAMAGFMNKPRNEGMEKVLGSSLAIIGLIGVATSFGVMGWANAYKEVFDDDDQIEDFVPCSAGCALQLVGGLLAMFEGVLLFMYATMWAPTGGDSKTENPTVQA
jgi:hypothetical protein